MNPVDIIQVDDDTRVAVYPDPDAENPRSWQEGISVHALRRKGGYNAPDAGTNSHGAALDEILDGASSSQVEGAIALHFQRANLPHRITASEAGEFVWYLEPETVAENLALAPLWNGLDLLDGVIAEYEQWANGEVYIVAVEKRTRWARLDQNGEPVFIADADIIPITLTTWEEVELIGGCYLDDDYTARQVAAEHFDIPAPTERLEYLRSQLRAESISYGELAELQSLVKHIDPGDVELLEAAGVPEFPTEKE